MLTLYSVKVQFIVSTPHPKSKSVTTSFPASKFLISNGEHIPYRYHQLGRVCILLIKHCVKLNDKYLEGGSIGLVRTRPRGRLSQPWGPPCMGSSFRESRETGASTKQESRRADPTALTSPGDNIWNSYTNSLSFSPERCQESITFTAGTGHFSGNRHSPRHNHHSEASTK